MNMFPISSDGVFEDLSIFFYQDKFLDDLLVDFPTNSKGNGESVKKRPRKALSSSEAQDNNVEGSSDTKKSAHRFIEKQRRQKMAALYASLRSLLPLEYIKGKRAISDHMQQAVNYINDVKKKMEEMRIRRDNLRKLHSNIVGSTSTSTSTSTTSVVDDFDNHHNSNSNSTRDCVRINTFKDGLMEILISSSLDKECFPLSMVLADLLGRQLSVINCISTRGDNCYLHKIQIELNDSTSKIDVSELQEGVVNVIKLA